MSTGDVAAIFDVDGTICDTRSTSSRALMWLRRRQHARWRHALWVAGLGWRLPLLWLTDRFSRDASDAQVYRQFGGLSAEQVAADVSSCCDAVLMPVCFPGALAEIAAHRAARRRVLFVSGGLEMLLAPLAERLGAELLGQHLVTANGRFTGVHRSYAVLGEAERYASQGARKAAALARYAQRHGIDLTRSLAYGDSINDIPMLELVGTPILVHPNRRLARLARARGWPVRDWRRPGHDGAHGAREL